MKALSNIFSIRIVLLVGIILLTIVSMVLLYFDRYDDLKEEKKQDLLKQITYCKGDIEQEYEKLRNVAENLSTFNTIHLIAENGKADIDNATREKLNLIFDLFQGFLSKIELVQNDKSLEIINLGNGNFGFAEKPTETLQFEGEEGFSGDDLNIFYKKIPITQNTDLSYIKFHLDFVELVKKSVSRFSSEKSAWYALISNNGKLLVLDAFNKDEQNKKIEFTNPAKVERFRKSKETGVIKDCILICEGKDVPVLSVFSKLQLMNSSYVLVFSTSKKFLFRSLNSYNLKMLIATVLIGVLLVWIFYSHAKVLQKKNNQLFESEKKFREIFESFVDLYYRTDVEGNLEMVSPSCYKLSGFKQKELVGKNVKDLYVNPVDRKFMVKILNSIGYVNDYEIELYNKDKVPIFVSMTSKLVYDENSKPIGIEGTLRDITERKLADKVILESKIKAESAVRTKNEFLTNLSHELKTPLNAIIGYAQLYKEDRELKPGIRKIFNIVENSGNYLLTLLNDLLDISKNDSGKLVIEKNSFNLHELIDGVVNIIRFRTDAKELDFVLDQSADLPRYLYGDAKRIRQILINLLGNAAKFTERGFVRLTLRYNDSILKFVISDSGCGIPETSINEIYKPFYQVKSKKEKSDGTGLGLTITKMLVEAMEGRIEVESDIEKGTAFTVTLKVEATMDMSEREAEQRKNMVSKFISSKGPKFGGWNFPVPDRKSLEVLSISIKNRNISEANLLLDRLESNEFMEFASKVRVNLDEFKIDYLVELLNHFLEEKNE